MAQAFARPSFLVVVPFRVYGATTRKVSRSRPNCFIVPGDACYAGTVSRHVRRERFHRAKALPQLIQTVKNALAARRVLPLVIPERENFPGAR